MKPTQEQIIAWAREAGFEVYDGDRFMPTHISDTLTHLHNPAVNLATFAYEAGRKDEREWQGLTDDDWANFMKDNLPDKKDGHTRMKAVWEFSQAKLKEKNGF